MTRLAETEGKIMEVMTDGTVSFIQLSLVISRVFVEDPIEQHLER